MTAAPLSTTAAVDALLDPRHPYAAHLRNVAAVDAAGEHRPWVDGDAPLPALYLSHGAPPLFEDSAWMAQLHAWARALPKPKAILIVSAHWESDSLGITSTTSTDLVYDFGGFNPFYHRMRYDTPDPTGLAQQLLSVLPATEHVYEHRNRGLDHGAWVPLKVMYPAADIPVLQLSLPTHDTAELLALGRRLRPLREQGVLVVGSGFLTHGLPFLTRDHWTDPDAAPPGWTEEFDAWAGEALERGDVDTLSRNTSQGPGMPYAHPTVEHYSPLFVTLGTADAPDDPATTTIDGFWMGLSKRSVQVA